MADRKTEPIIHVRQFQHSYSKTKNIFSKSSKQNHYVHDMMPSVHGSRVRGQNIKPGDRVQLNDQLPLQKIKSYFKKASPLSYLKSYLKKLDPQPLVLSGRENLLMGSQLLESPLVENLSQTEDDQGQEDKIAEKLQQDDPSRYAERNLTLLDHLKSPLADAEIELHRSSSSDNIAEDFHQDGNILGQETSGDEFESSNQEIGSQQVLQNLSGNECSDQNLSLVELLKSPFSDSDGEIHPSSPGNDQAHEDGPSRNVTLLDHLKSSLSDSEENSHQDLLFSNPEIGNQHLVISEIFSDMENQILEPIIADSEVLCERERVESPNQNSEQTFHKLELLLPPFSDSGRELHIASSSDETEDINQDKNCVVIHDELEDLNLERENQIIEPHFLVDSEMLSGSECSDQNLSLVELFKSPFYSSEGEVHLSSSGKDQGEEEKSCNEAEEDVLQGGPSRNHTLLDHLKSSLSDSDEELHRSSSSDKTAEYFHQDGNILGQENIGDEFESSNPVIDNQQVMENLSGSECSDQNFSLVELFKSPFYSSEGEVHPSSSGKDQGHEAGSVLVDNKQIQDDDELEGFNLLFSDEYLKVENQILLSSENQGVLHEIKTDQFENEKNIPHSFLSNQDQNNFVKGKYIIADQQKDTYEEIGNDHFEEEKRSPQSLARRVPHGKDSESPLINSVQKSNLPCIWSRQGKSSSTSRGKGSGVIIDAEEEDFTQDKENFTPNSKGVVPEIKRPLESVIIHHEEQEDILPVRKILEERKSYGARMPFQSLMPSTIEGKKTFSLLDMNAITGRENKKWIMVVDTSCLLKKNSMRALQFLRGLKETQLIIPRIVIRELDCMKRRDRLLRRRKEVSSALEWIEECMANTSWWIHVQSSMEEGTPPAATPFSSSGNFLEVVSPNLQDYILECALHLRTIRKDGQLIVLSDDIGLKIKSMAEGLICEEAEEFCESVVNPLSGRFLWTESLPRGATRCFGDAIVLREKCWSKIGLALKKPSLALGEEGAVKGLKLLLPDMNAVTGGENKMWIMVVDTNCLLKKNSMKAIQNLRGLKGTQLIVPRIVIRELDWMKRRDRLFRGHKEVSSALEWIEECMANTSWWIHVQSSMEEGTPPAATPFSFSGHFLEVFSPTLLDNILECALHFRTIRKDGQLVVISNDVALKIKSMAEGLICEEAEEFGESLVNPLSERFLWAESCPRGATWSRANDIVLRDKCCIKGLDLNKPSSSRFGKEEGEVKGLKLLLL